jgi:hypothetical protein
MLKLMLAAFAVLVCGSTVMAQNKVETKWHCPNSPDHNFDVGDVAGHSYAVIQGSCTATSSDKGFAEKTGAYTEFQERWKASQTNHGRFNVTMENGDKVYYTYQGSAPMDMSKPAANTWKIVSGEGKHKGIKGSGSCKATRTKDGSSDWTCTGTYSMGQ